MQKIEQGVKSAFGRDLCLSNTTLVVLNKYIHPDDTDEITECVSQHFDDPSILNLFESKLVVTKRIKNTPGLQKVSVRLTPKFTCFDGRKEAFESATRPFFLAGLYKARSFFNRTNLEIDFKLDADFLAQNQMFNPGLVDIPKLRTVGYEKTGDLIKITTHGVPYCKIDKVDYNYIVDPLIHALKTQFDIFNSTGLDYHGSVPRYEDHSLHITSAFKHNGMLTPIQESLLLLRFKLTLLEYSNFFQNI